MIYFRRAKHTAFLLPTIAVGIDVRTGLPFLEAAWWTWAVGLGELV